MRQKNWKPKHRTRAQISYYLRRSEGEGDRDTKPGHKSSKPRTQEFKPRAAATKREADASQNPAEASKKGVFLFFVHKSQNYGKYVQSFSPGEG